MVKKTKEHEINLKVYKYKWKKELEKSEPDKKLIRNQIDSFIFMIQNSESFHSKTYLDEMTLFSKMVLSYGQISKLNIVHILLYFHHFSLFKNFHMYLL